jgi:hypothetical protein
MRRIADDRNGTQPLFEVSTHTRHWRVSAQSRGTSGARAARDRLCVGYGDR